MEKVVNLFRGFGLSGRFRGYYFLVEALYLVMEWQYRPFHITKDIYPAVARICGSRTECVEYGIRSAADYCWKNRKEQLCDMAGYPLDHRPTNLEFIEILSNSLRTGEPTEDAVLTGSCR